MGEYSQAERPLRVYSELGEDVLLLGGFRGTEAVSQLYRFQLDLLSKEDEIDPADILRTPILVEASVAKDETRYIHGMVSRFAMLGKRDDLTFYRAEVVPWLWFLTLSRESRMYQELTVPDILEQVFKRTGYSDFEFRLTRSYSQRLFCVQYRESHFAFVSRLMEEEGIFYFFEHTDEKHLLVLTDDSTSSVAGPGPDPIRFSPGGHTDECVISEFEREHRVFPGRMTLWEYDYLKPTVALQQSQGENDEEVYDYPGGYREHDDGDRRARLLLEAEEAERQVVRGAGTASGMIPGCHFKLEDHFQKSANGKYLITWLQHQASAGEFRAWAGEAALDYRNEFLAIPHATPYRPRRQTPRPVIHGSQSALVVGPAGEEVHVDEHGRVKVHFYWDRDSEKNEKSSCWIRVTTPWGGKGYGSVSIPRIGNEVMVAFEEGDPDRPIIIGSVYNADQSPPFSLPGAGIQMGMHSRSSPGGGGNNEITMTDTAGSEMMNIHAQFDQVTTVENDQTNTINNNRTTSVAVDDTESVGGNQAVSVTGNQSIDVTGDQNTTVAGSQGTEVTGARSVTVSADQTHDVGGSDTTTVGGARESTIGGDDTTTVSGNQSLDAGGDFEIVATGNITLQASGDIDIVAAGSIGIIGTSGIMLNCGGSTVNITPGSIEITSSGTVTVMGALVKIN